MFINRANIIKTFIFVISFIFLYITLGTFSFFVKAQSDVGSSLVVPTQATTQVSIGGIYDGDLIKTASSPDIYIVKLINGKRFKRLILNPDIFNSYGHLSWDNVKTVTESVMNSYTISDLVREIYPDGSIVPPGNVYKLYPRGDLGAKRLIRMTQSEFERGFDKDSIYNINHLEASDTFYRMGRDFTILDDEQYIRIDLSSITEEDHILGSINAPIKLVVYSDLRCPFCKNLHPTLKDIARKYGKDVALVYRHFPLSFHPQAKPAAVASECVSSLAGNDSFWDFIDYMFENQDIALNKTSYEQKAVSYGININEFRVCLDNDEYVKKVEEDMQAGRKIYVSGTPTTIIVAPDSSKRLIVGAQKEKVFTEIIDLYI